MNICFSKAVVEVLFFCVHRLASWRVHPLKLTTKYILLSKHILVVVSHDFIMIRSRDVRFFWSVTKCKKCEGSAMGCITLFYKRIMTIGLRYSCILLCWPFGFVFWRFHRLCSPWVSICIVHNDITLYRYNYSETADVFFLGGSNW